MPGPLPNAQRRRRNAPSIPTTQLPAAGRSGPIPKPPKSHRLGDAGSVWWRWAWRLPQAAAWSAGDLFVIARRAQLEDDVTTLAAVEGLDLDEVLAAEKAAEVRLVVGRLAAIVTGRLAIVREMRELDDRLGLTPKGMAALRWSIVADETPQAEPSADGVVVVPDRWRVGAG